MTFRRIEFLVQDAFDVATVEHAGQRIPCALLLESHVFVLELSGLFLKILDF